MNDARWQFSIRDLLLVTTIVSICLAIGVHYVGVIIVVVTVGLIEVAILLYADWLIHPENRRALAFVTAFSWATLGSGLLALAGRAGFQAIQITTDASGEWMLGIFLLMGAIASYLMAAYRWRQIVP